MQGGIMGDPISSFNSIPIDRSSMSHERKDKESEAELPIDVNEVLPKINKDIDEEELEFDASIELNDEIEGIADVINSQSIDIFQSNNLVEEQKTTNSDDNEIEEQEDVQEESLVQDESENDGEDDYSLGGESFSHEGDTSGSAVKIIRDYAFKIINLSKDVENIVVDELKNNELDRDEINKKRQQLELGILLTSLYALVKAEHFEHVLKQIEEDDDLFDQFKDRTIVLVNHEDWVRIKEQVHNVLNQAMEKIKAREERGQKPQKTKMQSNDQAPHEAQRGRRELQRPKTTRNVTQTFHSERKNQQEIESELDEVAYEKERDEKFQKRKKELKRLEEIKDEKTHDENQFRKRSESLKRFYKRGSGS